LTYSQTKNLCCKTVYVNVCRPQTLFSSFFFFLQVTYTGTAQPASVLREFAGITTTTNLHLAYPNSAALSQTPADENSGNSILLLKYLKEPVLSLCSQCWFSKVDRQPQITLHWSRETELVFSVGSATCTLTCMFVGLNNEISGNEGFTLCPSLIFREGGSLSQRSRLIWKNWEESQSSGSGPLHYIPSPSSFLLQI